MNLLPADLIFTRSASLLGRAIRWFERGRGEAKSWTNHTAGIGMFAGNVVEAQTHVISTPFDEWKEGKEFEVWRTSDLTDETRLDVARYADSQLGRDYGYLKLIPHALDGLLSKITGGSPYVFRRMFFLKNYPICSWLWACAYAKAGLKFGGDPEKMSPDDQHDFVLSHSDKWWRIE